MADRTEPTAATTLRRLRFKRERWEQAPRTFGATLSFGRLPRFAFWLYVGRTSFGVWPVPVERDNRSLARQQ